MLLLVATTEDIKACRCLRSIWQTLRIKSGVISTVLVLLFWGVATHVHHSHVAHACSASHAKAHIHLVEAHELIASRHGSVKLLILVHELLLLLLHHHLLRILLHHVHHHHLLWVHTTHASPHSHVHSHAHVHLRLGCHETA